MEVVRRAGSRPARLGVFPGAFNPLTRAHVELARAALAEVDEVLFVLPREFPHKPYQGATLRDRLRLLEAALSAEPRFSLGVSEGGLFIEIARECRRLYGPGVELVFLCGRDAAERIVNWEYGRAGAFAEMLADFALLVAARQGEFEAPARFADRIRRLTLDVDLDAVSATAVRQRIARGEPWEHLVPDAAVPLVREIYGAAVPFSNG